MRIDGVMLSSLATGKASLAISGADDANPEGDPKDGDKDQIQGDPDKSKDEKKDEPKTGEANWTADKERRLTNLEEERQRIHDARTKAEGERDAAVQELNELKAKGATDEDAKGAITSMTAERDALLVDRDNLRKKLAFVSTPGYDWVDADAALKLADLSKVEIDKAGEVQGMKVALDDLAKKSPYLLKPKVDSDDDKDGKDKDPKRTGDPAPRSRQTNTEKDKQAREGTLRNKYPALRR